MRKILSVLLAFALAATLFAGCSSGNKSSAPGGSSTAPETPSGSESTPVETVKIRVAHHAGLAGSIIPGIDTIEGNDFFKSEGLDVEWVKFTSGPPEVAAMVSGDLQFGYIGHGAHTLAAENKIHIISLNNLGNSERIMAHKASGITKLEDMKGKVIATQLGTSGEVILNLALNKAGLSRNDVTVMNMDMAGAVTAFIAKQVDVIACWDIHATNVMDKVGADNLNIIASTQDFSEESSFPSSWTVTPEYAEKNPDVVVRFIRALNKCYEYRDANYDESIRSAAEFAGSDYETFNKGRENVINFTPAQIKEYLDNGGMKAIYQLQLDYFIKEGKVKEGNVDTYVRTDLMEKAFAE